MDLDLGTDRLRVERDGAIGWIVYDHPERHNALTGDMVAAVPRAVAALAADDDVRVVVLRGAGERAFISGGDVGGVRGDDGRGPDPARMFAGLGGEALLDLDKPVIAMVHGWCLGGGLLTALCADLRVAADDAVFGIPAVRLGVGYPYDGADLLVQAVGTAHASEILLTGDRYPAADALRLGLVHRVVPKADLEAATRALADQLAA